MPYNTVKSHIRRNPEIPGASVCIQCGKPVKQPGGRKEKKFARIVAEWPTEQQPDKVKKQAYT